MAIKKIDKKSSAEWNSDKSGIIDLYPTVTRITGVPTDGRYGAVKYGRTVLCPVAANGRVVFSPDYDDVSVVGSQLQIGGLGLSSGRVVYNQENERLEFTSSVEVSE